VLLPSICHRDVTPAPDATATEAAQIDPIPEWFDQFLNDRQTRKPSAHRGVPFPHRRET
jgi:integrase/recombinase XerC